MERENEETCGPPINWATIHVLKVSLSRSQSDRPPKPSFIYLLYFLNKINIIFLKDKC